MIAGGPSESQKYLLRMNDGRQFTDWTPRGAAPSPSDPVSAVASKTMLMSNASDIMNQDRKKAATSVGVSLDSLAEIAPVPGFEVKQFCNAGACGFEKTVPEDGKMVIGLQPSARSPDALPGAATGLKK